MAVSVRLPTVLRKYTNGEAIVQTEGATVLEVIDGVDGQFPGFRSQIVDAEGRLHRFINLYLNDEDVRYLDALETKVGPGDVVSILPAVAGG